MIHESKIDKLEFITIKKNGNASHRLGENICKISNTRLVFKICKELLNINNKQNNQLKHGRSIWQIPQQRRYMHGT